MPSARPRMNSEEVSCRWDYTFVNAVWENWDLVTVLPLTSQQKFWSHFSARELQPAEENGQVNEMKKIGINCFIIWAGKFTFNKNVNIAPIRVAELSRWQW